MSFRQVSLPYPHRKELRADKVGQTSSYFYSTLVPHLSSAVLLQNSWQTSQSRLSEYHRLTKVKMILNRLSNLTKGMSNLISPQGSRKRIEVK